MRVLLSLVTLIKCEELLALEYAAVTFQQIQPANLKVAKKSLDFVKKMRQDLRRNNDDYAQRDIEGLSQLESPSLPAHPAPRLPNRKRYPAAQRLPPSAQAGLPQRYFIDARRGEGDVVPGTVTQSDMTQGDVNQGEVNQGDVNQGEVNQGDVNQGEVNQGDVTLTTAFRSNTRARPVKKSLRMSKLKKTFSREKNKLRPRDQGKGRATEMDMDLVMADTKRSTLPTTVPTRPIPPRPASPPPPPRPRRKHTLRTSLRDSVSRSEQPVRQVLKRDSPLSKASARQAPPRDSPVSEEQPARQAPPRDFPVLEKLARQAPPRDYPLLKKPARQAPPRDYPLLKKPARQATPRDSHLSEEQPTRQTLHSTVRYPAPQPDQIDMAHARNPIITRIRMKGRLCQRSLMNVEGPMYDKEGKQMVPAHNPALARGRLFHETRKPELVLPKCCNCCKKSVLGCQ